MSGITVGLVDDQVLFLNGIHSVISSQPDMSVQWQKTNGQDGVNSAITNPVDVILMDVQMPVLDGISATRQITEKQPTTKTVILTTFDDEDYVLGGLSAGASGFILKDAEPETLLASIRTIVAGDAVISPRATTHIISRLHRKVADPAAETSVLRLSPEDHARLETLTGREREVLTAVGRGWTNTEICQRLFISMPTVKTHVGRVMAKTGSRDRVHVALFAYRTGLVDRSDLLDS
ncbi:response regulator [Corynebacterium lubricantis]|uniref:response regulator n=1 Tax=Corynebacterium lubricantis TaxID=541095 RepID=UPI0003640E54|nr:response regulator transcription factor [Corynebacterium lubricantis]